MPGLTRPRRSASAPRALVLGDLMLDVILAPDRALELATDVPGRVSLRQGGSAATTAKWLVRLGVQTSLVCAVGRDTVGRALVASVTREGVRVRGPRVASVPTGRIGVLVGPDGERSFVADRGAADRLAPDDLRAGWFERVEVLHVPAYSLLTQPLGDAARIAIGHARRAGARISVDLASVGPLLVDGRRGARGLLTEARPTVIFATVQEAQAVVGPKIEALAEFASVVIVKRGARGATVLAREGEGLLRFEVATRPLPATDTTGAGDAFDGGFLAGWLLAERRGAKLPTALQRAALTGHRAAARQLARPTTELDLG